jgi:hypothetical protein
MLEHLIPEPQEESVSNMEVESEYRPVPALSLALGYVHRADAAPEPFRNEAGQ